MKRRRLSGRLSESAQNGIAMNHNITVEEAALRLGLSVATVKRRLASGSLSGQKIGGRWLVHGDKMPAAASSPSLSRSAGLDMASALGHVLRTDRRDLWVPDILNWEDFRELPDQVLRAAEAKCQSGLADPVEMVEVPKGEYLTRAGTLLTLEDRVAYQALAEAMAPVIDSALSACVFSSRLAGGGRDFFKSGVQQWQAFESAVSQELTFHGRWLVETDLASYFETVSHQVLFDDLRGLGVPEQLTAPLRRLLADWRRRSHSGLPIGPDASRLLGNIFMARVDHAMEAAGYRYFRFMDDVRIVAATEQEAKEALRRFEVLCRDRGLIVSGAKTKVSKVDLLAPTGDEQIAEADYFLRNGLGEARKALRSLFLDAVKEKAIKRRHAKFALLRLGTLVDRGVLKKLLARLESLQELSPDSAFYLRAFISEKAVQREISSYLARPGEPGMEVYQQAWLMAAMLEVIGPPPVEWVRHASQIAWDANRPTYLRVIAVNMVALGARAEDVERIREEASRSYDPAWVRGLLTALQRVECLDKALRQKVAARHPQLGPTMDYLAPRKSLPSLIQDGLWSSLRTVPNS